MVLLLQNKKLNHFFFNENKIIDINIVFFDKKFFETLFFDYYHFGTYNQKTIN